MVKKSEKNGKNFWVVTFSIMAIIVILALGFTRWGDFTEPVDTATKQYSVANCVETANVVEYSVEFPQSSSCNDINYDSSFLSCYEVCQACLVPFDDIYGWDKNGCDYNLCDCVNACHNGAWGKPSRASHPNGVKIVVKPDTEPYIVETVTTNCTKVQYDFFKDVNYQIDVKSEPYEGEE